MIRKVLKRILGQRVAAALRILIRGLDKPVQRDSCLEYDYSRFTACSGAYNPMSRETLRANIVMRYHVLEKGLTMPNKKLGFGQKNAGELIQLIAQYKRLYVETDFQVSHAISVLRAYWDMHINYATETIGEEKDFWNIVKLFADANKDIPPAFQRHLHRDEFYLQRNAPFPEFAWARHTLRHYAKQPLSTERLAKAIDLARSTPSACNRQYCRVHCISDKDVMERLLAIQGGNRGFGCYADKVLVLTADLRCSVNSTERNDVYVNGGMYLMNLCYSLYYYEIAHCILNWSRTPEEDKKARTILSISPSETIIALLSCGETPEEFDLAESPRTPIQNSCGSEFGLTNNENRHTNDA